MHSSNHEKIDKATIPCTMAFQKYMMVLASPADSRKVNGNLCSFRHRNYSMVFHSILWQLIYFAFGCRWSTSLTTILQKIYLSSIFLKTFSMTINYALSLA